MNRHEMVCKLNDQIAYMSDEDLSLLLGVSDRLNDPTVRTFLKVLGPQAPPEPCERRNCIPQFAMAPPPDSVKFVVDEPGWKGCDGFPL